MTEAAGGCKPSVLNESKTEALIFRRRQREPKLKTDNEAKQLFYVVSG